MDNKVQDLIDKAVKRMIDGASSDKRIARLAKKHDKKVHFVPKRYRVFGGILQSLNIQFGNFLEELMAVIVEDDGKYEIISEYSGKKSNKFKISAANESLIDGYIATCQIENPDLEQEFPKLIQRIISDNDDTELTFQHDIDLLFRDKNTGVYYYLEIKYNDDHDTGKFVDINRKFIKTAAYLINELSITDPSQFKPILFFFNNKKLKGNIYVPEKTNIYRGERFFDEFLSNVVYSDVEKYMANLSESKGTVEAFDALYAKIMSYQTEN